jgi:hypothetical protein
MHCSRISVLALVATSSVACGGSVSHESGHGAGGTSGAGGSGNTAGLGGGTSTQLACGGGLKGCPPDEYCDFGGATCGSLGELGVCKPRPGTCGVCDCAGLGLCGCDGKIYETACEAHLAGVDISSSTACLPNPNDCDAEAGALASKLQGIACTTVVLLDPDQQFAITGYKILCGTWAGAIDEPTAAATAFADTGYGTQCGGGVIPGVPGNIDQIVFFHPATAAACACCGDGWVASVSATTGLSVFGAGLPLGAPAKVTFPKSWDSPADLGSGCSNSTPPTAQVRGYDLSSSLSSPATPLDTATTSSALAAVFATALPRAVKQAGHAGFENAVMLEYVRASGEDLIQHDLIVLLSSHLVLP